MPFFDCRKERPTAAVCVSDYLAVSLAERLEHLGISILQGVALIGFHGIVLALPNGLGLTTVAQPYEEIGILALGLLMRRIKDASAAPQMRELPARLVVCASRQHTLDDLQDTCNG